MTQPLSCMRGIPPRVRNLLVLQAEAGYIVRKKGLRNVRGLRELDGVDLSTTVSPRRIALGCQ